MKTVMTWESLMNEKPGVFRADFAEWQKQKPESLSEELLFTQSNARVLLGQSPAGIFRFLSMPTQVFPVPTTTSYLNVSMNCWPGMYYQSNMINYIGDLQFLIYPDGCSTPLHPAADSRENVTFHALDFLPVTQARLASLDCLLTSFAPVALDAQRAPLTPAPLPGPAGAIHVMRLRNTSAARFKGAIKLVVGKCITGHYEEVDSYQKLKEEKPATGYINHYYKQKILILNRPEGSVGIHWDHADGDCITWTEQAASFTAARQIDIGPGEELVLEVRTAISEHYNDIVRIIYELGMENALAWLNRTAAFWRERLGSLQVGCATPTPSDGPFSRDFFVRSILDNFNCVQTDANGSVLSLLQGAPAHRCGMIWGIDVEPTALSIAMVCPELARQILLFFMNRSRAPHSEFGLEHSTPILVAPLIIARNYCEITGDVAFFQQRPDVWEALDSLIRDLMSLRDTPYCLFPSRFASDGSVGRRYDYGVNVKTWYAFDSYAYLLNQVGKTTESAHYANIARQLQADITRTMEMIGPLGPQISGGTNLKTQAKPQAATAVAPEDASRHEHSAVPTAVQSGIVDQNATVEDPYYDGEDTSSMLAPDYGICDYDDPLWLHYHQSAWSIWCPNFDPEFETLRWAQNGGPVDGSSYFARLGGSDTEQAMSHALQVIQNNACDLTGSVYWWPRDVDNRRGLTRCSDGQGAWASKYMRQWLGITVDSCRKTITIAPRGMLSRVQWDGFRAGPFTFDIDWQENEAESVLRIRNDTDASWTVRFGVRKTRSGVYGPLRWQDARAMPKQELTLRCLQSEVAAPSSMVTPVRIVERKALGGDNGIVLKRFGCLSGKEALILRFYVLNGTAADWTSATLNVHCADQWQVYRREPKRWQAPFGEPSSTASHSLSPLPKLQYETAVFWLRLPYKLDMGPLGNYAHCHTEPLVFMAPEVSQPIATEITVDLCATLADGTKLTKKLAIPCWIKGKGECARQS